MSQYNSKNLGAATRVAVLTSLAAGAAYALLVWAVHFYYVGYARVGVGLVVGWAVRRYANASGVKAGLIAGVCAMAGVSAGYALGVSLWLRNLYQAVGIKHSFSYVFGFTPLYLLMSVGTGFVAFYAAGGYEEIQSRRSGQAFVPGAPAAPGQLTGVLPYGIGLPFAGSPAAAAPAAPYGYGPDGQPIANRFGVLPTAPMAAPEAPIAPPVPAAPHYGAPPVQFPVAPQYPAAQYPAAQYPAPQYAAPQYAAPQYPAVQYPIAPEVPTQYAPVAQPPAQPVAAVPAAPTPITYATAPLTPQYNPTPARNPFAARPLPESAPIPVPDLVLPTPEPAAPVIEDGWAVNPDVPPTWQPPAQPQQP